MSYLALVAAVIVATALSLAIAAPNGPAPQGWILAGVAPTSYEVGTAPQGGQFRGPAGFIRAKETPGGFGTLMQMVQAGDFRGKRVRFAATVRTEDVANWAGLWMRVDSERGDDGRPRTLAFDNMKPRGIKGTTGWQRYEVVLDVSEKAGALAYGILLDGKGAAWLDQVRLEEVPLSVPTTALDLGPPLPPKPQNLDFSR